MIVTSRHALVQISAIVYANPDWRPADGGQLRIWAPLGCAAAGRNAAANGSTNGTTTTLASLSADGAAPHFGPSTGNYAALLERALGASGARAGASSEAGSAARGGDVQNGDSSPRGCPGHAGPLQGREAVSGEVHWTMVDGEMVTDVEPTAGRLVLMLSGAVDHAVLPSYASRVALTAWCQ